LCGSTVTISGNDGHRLVLHFDDVLGSKVAAPATRAEPRDYIDAAAALRRYTRQQLIDLVFPATQT
jgi:hypothetical protein